MHASPFSCDKQAESPNECEEGRELSIYWVYPVNASTFFIAVWLHHHRVYGSDVQNHITRMEMIVEVVIKTESYRNL